MKLISLIGSRLLHYYRSNKLIFCIFFLSSVICGIGFLYLYGNYTMAMRNRNDQYKTYRTYSMTFSNNPITIKDISASLKKMKMSMEYSIIGAAISDNIEVCASVYGTPEITAITGESAFTEEENKNGSNVIIMPSWEPFNKPTGLNKENSTLLLNGTVFKIVGTHIDLEYYIPLKAYEHLGLPINRVKIIIVKKPTAASDTENMNELTALFPNAQITSPIHYNQDKDFPMELFMICIVYGISMLSFMFLMKYMMDMNSRENVIYSIVGASKGTVIQLLLLDNVCLSVAASLISIGIHILFKESLFDKFSVSSNLIYKPSDYILSFFLIILVSSLTVIPFIASYSRKSLISAKNAYSFK